jgi:hypothetical protein
MGEESGEKAEGRKDEEKKEKPNFLRVEIVRAWGAAVLRPYMNSPSRSDCVNTLEWANKKQPV